jgi:hypothetical protein
MRHEIDILRRSGGKRVPQIAGASLAFGMRGTRRSEASVKAYFSICEKPNIRSRLSARGHRRPPVHEAGKAVARGGSAAKDVAARATYLS